MKGKNKTQSKENAGWFRKIRRVVFIMLSLGFLFLCFEFFNNVYRPNVNLQQKKITYLKIPTGASYQQVIKLLSDSSLLYDITSFDWVSRTLKYPEHIHPGRYLIKKGMSNKDLVLLLRSGKQTPVKLVFNSIRTKDQFISRISHELEIDSVTFSGLLNDPSYLNQYGFSPDNVMAMFIPNTYEFYWNTDVQTFIKKMYKEYNRFWKEENISAATKINLNPIQVAILASIVEQETNKVDERPTVAGVYLNRLKRGQKLEADPTVVFALGDFSVHRVLNAYKQLDSPYNTYLYNGLPPGPICLPSIQSLKAVLNHKEHEYLYFCAKPDFSGYHLFAKTFEEHLENARKYQKELNRRNIKV